MPKISELTTLTLPITSSDYTTVIRPNSGGGYSSYKASLTKFGGITASAMVLTGSSPLIITGSGFFGTTEAHSVVSGLKFSTKGMSAVNGFSRVEIGNDWSLPYKSGLNIWSSGSLTDYASGSTYTFVNLGQTKCPIGGIGQHGYIIRSQYGDMPGSASYFSFQTASQAVWILRPSYDNQSDNSANSNITDAFDLTINQSGDAHQLVFRTITSSIGKASSLTIGYDDGSRGTGSFSAIGAAGTSGLRLMQGQIFAPRSYGAQIGYFGLTSYSNQVRMGDDRDGSAHIAFGSGSATSLSSFAFANNTGSIAIVSNAHDILISTEVAGLIGDKCVRVYSPINMTGSLTATGYINLGVGVRDALGITPMSTVRTGSLAYDTGSKQLMIFTGDGGHRFSGINGWRAGTSGEYSFASASAHASGYYCTSSAPYSHAEGFNTRCGGQASHTEGSQTSASGQASHAEGLDCIVIGNSSHAEGDKTLVIGDASHTEGYKTTASMNIGHAEGLNTHAAGHLCHSEGENTVAGGARGAHAEGFGTWAQATGSHTEGYYTTASADYQHVSGKYNITTTNSHSLFIIGNGISHAARSNILVVDTGSVIVGGYVTSSGLVIPPSSSVRLLTPVMGSSFMDGDKLFVYTGVTGVDGLVGWQSVTLS